MNEVTVDLSDLFARIVKKWKLIVCFALAFALLAGIYGYRSALHAAAGEAEEHERYVLAAPELPGYYSEELFRLRSALSENAAAFAEAYAEIYRSFLEKYDGAPITDHQEKMEAYMMFLDSYKDVISVMGGTQREFYELLITAEMENGDREKALVEPYSPSEPSFVQVKWIVIGILGGIFFAVVWIVVPYLATKKLRSERDLEFSFGVPVLAAAKSFSEEEIRALAAEIRIFVRSRGRESVFLWGSCDDSSSQLRGALLRALQDGGMPHVMSCEADPREEAVNIQNLSEAKTAFLVERTGKSCYSAIHREVELCRLTGAELLGCIVINQERERANV